MDDHDSFIFKRRINSNKQSIAANKNRSRLNKRKRQQVESVISEPFPFTVDTTDLPQVLSKCKICIFKNLNVMKLKTIAEGMGAEVSTELLKSTTHLIIEPKGDLRQLRVVNQAVSKGIICASPKWLLACYSERRFRPPTAYQYDIDESTHTLDAPTHDSQTTAVYNPFNTTYIDYDALEKQKPLEGGQLRMDGFLNRSTETSVPEDTSIANEKLEELTEENAVDTQEEEDGAKEFFYNSSNDFVEDTEETEEEKEARRLRSQQRNLEMEKALEERRLMLNEKKKAKSEVSLKKRRVVSNTYGERLKIWYGEQSSHQETVKRRGK